MIPATREEQRRLYDLQQVDTAIRQLQHRRANLDEQKALDENAATLTKIASDYGQRKERLEILQTAQKRHEDEIAAVESRRKSEDNRMYSGMITSEKEAEAVRNEVASLRSRKRDLEDALLEIMEEREELEAAVATLQERHAELTAKVAELTTARDAAAKEIDAELAERDAQRSEIVTDVPDEIREHYEQLLVRKQDVAVAKLDRTTCEGCHLQLTQIEMEEAREQVTRGLSKCPQCGRIIVLD